jgi:hypothetical protein
MPYDAEYRALDAHISSAIRIDLLHPQALTRRKIYKAHVTFDGIRDLQDPIVTISEHQMLTLRTALALLPARANKFHGFPDLTDRQKSRSVSGAPDQASAPGASSWQFCCRPLLARAGGGISANPARTSIGEDE